MIGVAILHHVQMARKAVAIDVEADKPTTCLVENEDNYQVE